MRYNEPYNDGIPSLKLTWHLKNGWLEDDPFLLGFTLFSGAFAVSFREGSLSWNILIDSMDLCGFGGTTRCWEKVSPSSSPSILKMPIGKH